MRIPALTATSIAAMVALLVAGCSSSNETADPGPGPSNGSGATGRPIDTLTVALSQGDTPDPAYGGGILTLETTQGLLTFGPRVNGKVGPLGPGLAKAVPTATDGGKTYTFELAPDVTYSDGTKIKASDFEYAIKRLYRADSGYVGKFGLIEGALAFGKSKKGDIAGIVTDDSARTVTFHLTAAMATFPQLMASFFSAPVPSGTPVAQTNTIPSTGPMKLEKFSPDEGYTLVKNPSFKPSATLAAPIVSTIVATVVSDPGIALTKTLDGTYDYNDQTVPADQVSAVLTDHAAQSKVVALAETSMFSMNTSRAPFEDVRVRKAVNYALDREAMAKLSGGTQLPTQNVLPPGESSYIALNDYTYDLAKAKALVTEAGAVGKKVNLLASGDPASEPYVVYLANQLKLIGLAPKIKVVPSATFFGVPSVPATTPDMSWYPWNELIPDGSDWIGQLFDGTLINPTNNKNWSMFDDATVNKEIAAASLLPLGAERDRAWAALDRKLVVDQAVVAPYANPARVAVFSPRIDPSCFTQFVGGQALASSFCLK